MYEFFSWINRIVNEPFSAVALNSNIAWVSALFLGFVGSVAPCQISANLGAITYFGNRQFQQKLSWVEVIVYMAGKITVFSLLGIIFWLFGRSLSNEMIPFFSYMRKALGPILIIMGVFLLGWIKLPGSLGFRISALLQSFSRKVGGKWGAYLLGAAFSLGFCPTMFWLFFGLVMPMVLQSPYGFVLPSVFAIGTAMPFLLFAGLTVAFGLDVVMLRRSRQWGKWIRMMAGGLFIILGIADTMTFWV